MGLTVSRKTAKKMQLLGVETGKKLTVDGKKIVYDEVYTP